MAVERQAVRPQIRQRQEQQAPSQIVDRTERIGEADLGSLERSTQIAEGLSSLAQSGAQLVDYELKKKIELDKVTQRQRYFTGQDPTSDATRPGRRAYNILSAREQATQAQNQVYQEVVRNPSMSDEEFEQKTREVYNGMYEQYQDDPLMTKALTNMFSDTQQALATERAKVRYEYERQQAVEAFGASVSDSMEATDNTEQLATSLREGQLATEARALGLSQEEQDTLLLERARVTAASGDERLLAAMEGLERFENSEDLMDARNQYNQAKASQDRISVGSRTADIESRWVTGDQSWSTTQAQLDALGEEYPTEITPAYVRSLKLRGEKARADAAGGASFNSQYKPGQGVPIRLDQRFTEKEKREGAKQFEQQIATWATNQIESGADPVQVQTQAANARFQYTTDTGLEVGDLRKQLKFLANQTPEMIESDPTRLDSFKGILRSVRNVPRGTLSMYASGKDLETLEGFKTLAGAYGDDSAWRMAYEAAHNPRDLTPEEEKDLRSSVSDSTEDAIDGSIIPWRIGNIGGIDDPSEDERQRINQEVQTTANLLLRAGAVDAETAVRGAVDIYKTQNTVLSNGTTTRVTTGIAAQAAGVQPEEVPFLWEGYFEENKAALQEESAIDDLEYEDVRVHVAPGSGVWYLRDGLGNRITDGQPMSALQRYGVNATKLREINQRAQESQAARERAAQQRGPAGRAR